MKLNRPAVLMALGTLLIVLNGGLVEAQIGEVEVSSAAEARALLDRYCVRCHNDRLTTAGLSLESVNLDEVADGLSYPSKDLTLTFIRHRK